MLIPKPDAEIRINILEKQVLLLLKIIVKLKILIQLEVIILVRAKDIIRMFNKKHLKK